MTESLQEIERLVEGVFWFRDDPRFQKEDKAALLSAITRVVQERDKLEKALQDSKCYCAELVQEEWDDEGLVSGNYPMCARCKVLSTAER